MTAILALLDRPRRAARHARSASGCRRHVLRRGFAVIVTVVAVALLLDVLVLGGPPA